MAPLLKDPLEREMLALGEAARAAAQVLALAPRAAKDAALLAAAAALRDTAPCDPGRQRPRHGRRAREGPGRRHARPPGARSPARRGHGRWASRPSRRWPTRSAVSSPAGRGPTAWTSPGCGCRSAWSGSSTRAARTSPPTPAPCASRPATPPCCAAARRASTPPGRSAAALAHGLGGSGPAGGGDPAGADHRPRCRRHDAADERAYRRHRAARRQLADRAGAGREQGAGARPPRGQLPHLPRTARPIRRWRSSSRVNAKLRRTGVCGATETPAGRPRLLPSASCRRSWRP